MAGFDLGGIGDMAGGLLSGKGLDLTAAQPLWEQVQPTLKGLPTDDIIDNVANWAKGLNLPLVDKIPSNVIDDIKNGVKVPLNKLLKG